MSNLQVASEIVNGSGNSFHCKVVEAFRNQGWSVSISPYYLDGSTNKAREIDLVAEKAWPYNSLFDSRKAGNVTVKLFVECKYLPKVNVFWFDDVDTTATLDWLSKNLPGNHPKVWLEKHHYLRGQNGVAKLFASENSPQVENEPIYKAINQSLNSVVNLRRSKSIVPKGTNGYRSGPIFTLEMPVIVCNSFENAYRTTVKQGEVPTEIESDFKIEVNYAYANPNAGSSKEYFLIDMVDYSKIDVFFQTIESDANLITSCVRIVVAPFRVIQEAAGMSCERSNVR